MKLSSKVLELRCFLGMVNQVVKFSPNIAELTKPLQDPAEHQKHLDMRPSQTDAFT